MTVALPAGARVPSSPARPTRLAVSHLERCLAGTTHSWAIRAVFHARLEAQGIRAEPIDVLLYGPGRSDA